jgi:hypothetical protein
MVWNPCSLCRGITIHFAVEWLFSLRGIRINVREQGIVADTASVRLVITAALLTLMISTGTDSQYFAQHRDSIARVRFREQYRRAEHISPRRRRIVR